MKAQGLVGALNAVQKGSFILKDALKKEAASIAFIHASTIIEIEICILALAACPKTTTEVLRLKLKQFESIALWIMMTNPHPPDRYERCVRVLRDSHNEVLTESEVKHTLEEIHNRNFGKNSEGRKKAVAILERLNRRKDAQHLPMNEAHSLEHVLPQNYEQVKEWKKIWSQPDASNWKHRLGNLALLDPRSNSKIGNKSFETKKTDLRKSPFPLTSAIAKNGRWDSKAVQKNHEKYLNLIRETFHI